jgi:exopolyphosphatase/guanosine-5'-triphosphate,3'-diphosphate pyrophosphatase
MEPLFRLLSETDIQEAEALGKAMRFGAMFSIGDPSQAGALRWNQKKRELTLALTEDGVGLFGEVAQARFAALALALKAQTRVVLKASE